MTCMYINKHTKFGKDILKSLAENCTKNLLYYLGGSHFWFLFVLLGKIYNIFNNENVNTMMLCKFSKKKLGDLVQK